jgi:hypothetical protein
MKVEAQMRAAFAVHRISAGCVAVPCRSQVAGVEEDSDPVFGEVEALAVLGGRATTGERVVRLRASGDESARLWREYNYPVMSPLLEMTLPFTPN